MAAIPEPESQTLLAIEAAVARNADRAFRPHLGASLIGRPCLRQLWYSFRWAKRVEHSPRMLRLFERGQREEATFVELLRNAGIQVDDVDPRTGKQYQFSVIGGHVGGSSDGLAEKVPEAPKTLHIVEMKTHNDKSFQQLVKLKVRQAKPEHWAQMQLYMHWSNLTRALYLAVNKNDDALYAERVAYDAAEACQLEAKAMRVVDAATPPGRLSDDPAWYQCKFCDYHDICHGQEQPERHCRTCLHATPELNGNARWSCNWWKQDIPSTKHQVQGCPQQRLIPQLFEQAHGCQVMGADPETNMVFYSTGLTDGGDHAGAA